MGEDKNWKQEKKEKKSEMTLEESKAYRASLHIATSIKKDETERREEFRIFWATNKQKYGKSKDLESILWAHLKSAKLDQPEEFESGIEHFGLKKIK